VCHLSFRRASYLNARMRASTQRPAQSNRSALLNRGTHTTSLSSLTHAPNSCHHDAITSPSLSSSNGPHADRRHITIWTDGPSRRITLIRLRPISNSRERTSSINLQSPTTPTRPISTSTCASKDARSALSAQRPLSPKAMPHLKI
jgi:hypothetical protein